MSDGFQPSPKPKKNVLPLEQAKGVRMVLTDVDGVLTSSQVIYDADGARLRAFSTRDGAAIQWLMQVGIPVGFISALDDPSTRKRGEDLGVRELHLGPQDKLATFCAVLERLALKPEEVAYFGDDLVDLPVLQTAGFAACPSDAAPEVQEACSLVLPQKGDEGFFRAATEFILKAQGTWDGIVARYRLSSDSRA